VYEIFSLEVDVIVDLPEPAPPEQDEEAKEV
jgi:hypothetical protein